MMRFWKTFLLRTLLAFGLLFLCLYFLIATHAGSNITLNTISFFSKDKFHFSSFEGTLSNTFTIQGIRHQSSTLRASADSITIAWSPSAFFKRTLQIENLNGNNIDILFLNEAPAEKRKKRQRTVKKKVNPTLPFYLSINQSEINGIFILMKDQTPINIEQLRLVFQANKKIRIDLNADLASKDISQVRLNANGTPDAFDAHLLLLGSGTKWSLSGSGDKNNFHIKTNKSLLFNSDTFLYGTVTRSPNLIWDLTFKTHKLTLPYLSTNIQELSLDTNTKGSLNHFEWDINEFSAEIFGETFSGKLALETTINKKRRPRSFSLDTQIKSLEVAHVLDDVKVDIPANGNLDLSLSRKGLTSTFALYLYAQKDNFIKAELALPNYKRWRKPKADDGINLKLNTAFDEFKLIQLFSPNTTDFTGAFKGELNAKGTLANPTLSGDASLENLSFSLLDLAIKPTLNLAIKANNDTLRYTGNLRSGDGQLTLEGQTAFSDTISTKLNVSGKNFLLSNLLKTKLIVSPKLTLENKQQDWHVTGKLLLSEADLDFGDMRTTVKLPSNAVIILPSGKVQETQAEPMKLYTNVKVTLGEDIKLLVGGLIGKLGGKLTIEQEPSNNFLGRGQIILNGKYDLLGEELTIKDGLINYNNVPLENPALNIRASRMIMLNDTFQTFTAPQNLEVGLVIQGNADDPKVTLFSNPGGWSQSDILSLILLGQPASSVSGADIQLLAKAAQMLSGKRDSGFSSLTSQLQKSFGLSDLRIQTGLTTSTIDDFDDTDDDLETSTSLVVGKHLSPKLYLSYSVGIFNALNTFRARYTLGKHWFLQTQTNTEGSGMDIFYMKEK